jgi:hypothetical protein
MRYRKNKYYPSRNGSFRRYNSYSVGYSEALQKGLVPDNASNRKKYGNAFDKCEPVEWHHGLKGDHVNFYHISDLILQKI